MQKWDRRFLKLAEHISEWSKDPSTKCGAVIVRPDRTIASVGYNGFPRGMSDALAFINNREVKYSRTVHAEMNALLSAAEPVKGCTLYTTPFMPCERCAVHMIQAGITRIVSYVATGERARRWEDAFIQTCRYLREAGVTLDIIERNPMQCDHGTRMTQFCKECAGEPGYRYTDADGITHSMWGI